MINTAVKPLYRHKTTFQSNLPVVKKEVFYTPDRNNTVAVLGSTKPTPSIKNTIEQLGELSYKLVQAGKSVVTGGGGQQGVMEIANTRALESEEAMKGLKFSLPADRDLIEHSFGLPSPWEIGESKEGRYKIIGIEPDDQARIDTFGKIADTWVIGPGSFGSFLELCKGMYKMKTEPNPADAPAQIEAFGQGYYKNFKQFIDKVNHTFYNGDGVKVNFAQTVQEAFSNIQESQSASAKGNRLTVNLVDRQNHCFEYEGSTPGSEDLVFEKGGYKTLLKLATALYDKKYHTTLFKQYFGTEKSKDKIDHIILKDKSYWQDFKNFLQDMYNAGLSPTSADKLVELVDEDAIIFKKKLSS